MRIYIVAADVQDMDEYRDYTTCQTEKRSWLPTVREDTETKYGEHVSIMGVYTTREQAETRVNKLTREKFPDLRIIEIEADSDCWQFIGGGWLW